jgi:hypothetical protein
MGLLYEFKCEKCHLIIEAVGEMIEYSDPVFGACARRIADCPECVNQSSEYFKPKPVKVSKSVKPACGNGNCCCMN